MNKQKLQTEINKVNEFLQMSLQELQRANSGNAARNLQISQGHLQTCFQIVQDYVDIEKEKVQKSINDFNSEEHF